MIRFEEECMTTRVHYESKSGRSVQGELAVPAAAGKSSALILVQEWWGLNDNIRAYADRYAAEGFVTLAVDLYDGAVTTDREEASHRMNSLDWTAALDHIAGAIHFLANHERSTGKVGITGFCMGGALTVAAAAALEGLGAAVPFYGIPGSFDAHGVKAPVLAHVANRDTWATPELMDAAAGAIRAAGGRAELAFYDADHAFMNMARPEVYDPASAGRAWASTVAFLRAELT
jgi:carboxymethylenebutenolidase